MRDIKIWKYPVPLTESQVFSLDLPKNARVLSVGKQSDGFVLWAEFSFDNQRDLEKRMFYWVFTGILFRVNDTDKFIQTITTEDGLVWHFYECITDSNSIPREEVEGMFREIQDCNTTYEGERRFYLVHDSDLRDIAARHGFNL